MILVCSRDAVAKRDGRAPLRVAATRRFLLAATLRASRLVSAEGEIKTDGSFRITTLSPNDGALLGRHRAIIVPPVPVGDTPTKPYAVNPRYLSYETSDLTANIEAKTNNVTLKIERRKK